MSQEGLEPVKTSRPLINPILPCTSQITTSICQGSFPKCFILLVLVYIGLNKIALLRATVPFNIVVTVKVGVNGKHSALRKVLDFTLFFFNLV
jgi:predicted SPOUT superfamily RNA methylase MTH1